MGSPLPRVARAGVAAVVAAVLLGGCGDGEAAPTTAADRPAVAAPGSTDGGSGRSTSEPAGSEQGGGTPEPKARSADGEPVAKGGEGSRPQEDRAGGDKPEGGSLAQLTERIERRLEQTSSGENRSLRELAEEALADPQAGSAPPGRSLKEAAEAILGSD